MNRPLALYKDFAISGNFNYFTNKTQSTYYKKIIQDYKIDYLAYFGPNPDLKHLKNCVSKLFKKKEKVGFHATRIRLIEEVIITAIYTILIVQNSLIVKLVTYIIYLIGL